MINAAGLAGKNELEFVDGAHVRGRVTGDTNRRRTTDQQDIQMENLFGMFQIDVR